MGTLDIKHYLKCKYQGNLHLTDMLWPKIITLNANTKAFATFTHVMGKSDKNKHYFKCKY